MAYLVDTNVLLRLTERANPLHPIVRHALRTLRDAGETLYFAPQIIAEYWCVATRPAAARGGLGLSVLQADREVRKFERLYTHLPEPVAAYNEWRRLLVDHGVSGVQVHDARLAATMIASGITHILTFNTADFARYTGITAVEPTSILTP